MRLNQTKVMNRAFKHNDNNKYELQGGHACFKKFKTVERQGFQEEFHEGVVWEEAVTRTGNSEERLKGAVRAGRIKTSGSGNREHLFYHFPRSRVGGSTTHHSLTEGEQSQDTTPEAFNQLAASIDALIPAERHIFGGGAVCALEVLTNTAAQGRSTSINIMPPSTSRALDTPPPMTSSSLGYPPQPQPVMRQPQQTNHLCCFVFYINSESCLVFLFVMCFSSLQQVA